jgi:hypothetical protein
MCGCFMAGFGNGGGCSGLFSSSIQRGIRSWNFHAEDFEHSCFVGHNGADLGSTCFTVFYLGFYLTLCTPGYDWAFVLKH